MLETSNVAVTHRLCERVGSRLGCIAVSNDNDAHRYARTSMTSLLINPARLRVSRTDYSRDPKGGIYTAPPSTAIVQVLE